MSNVLLNDLDFAEDPKLNKKNQKFFSSRLKNQSLISDASISISRIKDDTNKSHDDKSFEISFNNSDIFLKKNKNYLPKAEVCKNSIKYESHNIKEIINPILN